MELHNNQKLIVLIELQLNCTIYTVNCNFTIHATCPLALTTNKYNEL